MSQFFSLEDSHPKNSESWIKQCNTARVTQYCGQPGRVTSCVTVRAIVHLQARCSAPTHEAGRIGAGERRVDEPGGLPVGLQRDTHGVEQHAQTEFPSSRSCLTKM